MPGLSVGSVTQHAAETVHPHRWLPHYHAAEVRSLSNVRTSRDWHHIVEVRCPAQHVCPSRGKLLVRCRSHPARVATNSWRQGGQPRGGLSATVKGRVEMRRSGASRSAATGPPVPPHGDREGLTATAWQSAHTAQDCISCDPVIGAAGAISARIRDWDGVNEW